MKIGEITNSAEYRMDEQNQNLPIFGKNSKFYNFENHQISIIDKLKKINQSFEIVEFQKLANFKNLTICKTIKIQKISNLMVNY